MADLEETEIDADALLAAFDAHKAFWEGASGVTLDTIDLVRMGAMLAAILAYESAKQKGEAKGWRPIESAPKDGTEVLLYGPGVLNSDGRTSMYARARHVGWAQEIEGHLHWHTRDPRVTCRPIAWRPLPEPPTMLSAGGENG